MTFLSKTSSGQTKPCGRHLPHGPHSTHGVHPSFAGNSQVSCFCPDEASHVLEKYWTHLNDLSAHPDFASESPICQAEMLKFSGALNRLHRSDDWIPRPVAESSKKACRIAKEAAFSRLRPIADGPNQWEMHRQSALQSQNGTGSAPGLGSTGTCATLRSPLNT
jgi:hypothetical protein